MPTPINSVRTRVIELADGSYVAQLTTDGMMWYDAHHASTAEEAQVQGEYLADLTAALPSTGRVLWKSDAS